MFIHEYDGRGGGSRLRDVEFVKSRLCIRKNKADGCNCKEKL